MKAIQSFRSDKIRLALESFGGPSMLRSYISVFALSAVTIAKHYSNFEFITDDAGKFMAESCQLPYSKISSVGPNFDSDSCFWTHSKFVAYLSSEAFLHFDNDLFLWEPLPARIQNSELVALHGESYAWPLYERYLTAAQNTLPNFPTWHEQYFANRTPLNMAIFGGNNIAAINAYASKVLNVILNTFNGFKDANTNTKQTVEEIMPVMEQLWASHLLQSEQGIKVNFILTERNMVDSTSPADVKLTHIWGLKNDANTNPRQRMEMLNKVHKNLKELSPTVYDAVMRFTASPNTVNTLLELT